MNECLWKQGQGSRNPKIIKIVKDIYPILDMIPFNVKIRSYQYTLSLPLGKSVLYFILFLFFSLIIKTTLLNSLYFPCWYLGSSTLLVHFIAAQKVFIYNAPRWDTVIIVFDCSVYYLLHKAAAVSTISQQKEIIFRSCVLITCGNHTWEYCNTAKPKTNDVVHRPEKMSVSGQRAFAQKLSK